MTYILFITAIALSGVAAYYAIVGLTAIFAAAVIPIIIMGSILEVSKLVVASWLYRNWSITPYIMRFYFLCAIFVLMLLTSLGIFGFLSQAHLDQGVPTGDIIARVAIIDEKIKTERENIDTNKKTLAQLDVQINELVSRTTDDKGINRSLQIRSKQKQERKELTTDIQASQLLIAKLNVERAPIATELRTVEAEVGPIKYIAALIYGDSADASLLESSVRIVILMIVFVFDPLAVLMLIAANLSLKEQSNGKKINRKYWHRPSSNNESTQTKSSEASVDLQPRVLDPTPGPRATPEIESTPKVEKSIPVEIKKQIKLEDRIKIRDKGYVKQIPNDNDPTHKFNAKNPFSEKK
jgi:hypothetical protein